MCPVWNGIDMHIPTSAMIRSNCSDISFRGVELSSLSSCVMIDLLRNRIRQCMTACLFKLGIEIVTLVKEASSTTCVVPREILVKMDTLLVKVV